MHLAIIHALAICYFLFLYSGLIRAVVEGIAMKQQMVTLHAHSYSFVISDSCIPGSLELWWKEFKEMTCLVMCIYIGCNFKQNGFEKLFKHS